MLRSYGKLGDAAPGFWVYPKQTGNRSTVFIERQGSGYGHASNRVHLLDQGISCLILSNTHTIDLNAMRVTILAAYLGSK